MYSEEHGAMFFETHTWILHARLDTTVRQFRTETGMSCKLLAMPEPCIQTFNQNPMKPNRGNVSKAVKSNRRTDYDMCHASMPS